MSRAFGSILVKTVLQLFKSICILQTLLFNNTRTQKFKTQPTFSIFTAANIIADVSGNNDALRKMVKRSCLWVRLVDIDPFCQLVFSWVQCLSP